MSQILYLQASPRRERSSSIAVADAFVGAYKQKHPDDQVSAINLFDHGMLHFDGNALQGKYNILQGRAYTAEEKAAWRQVEAEIETFTAADKYVFAVPMWNFSIPYRLKQYIDIIVQPGYTFSFLPETGFSGLVTGRPAFVAYARGSAYPPGSEMAAMDMQTPYMEKILGFMGFTDIRSVIVEPTLSDPEAMEKQLSGAREKAREMAETF